MTVESYLEVMVEVFRCPEIFTIPQVTPHHFCKKCYLVMSKVKNGKTVLTGRKLLDWEECGANCRTCDMLLNRQEIRGRHKKVSNITVYALFLIRKISDLDRASCFLRFSRSIKVS